ncbi:glycoside hydrolase family 43 protein [Aspergillus clavatus NRRL 1]|uniref:Xylosidase/arabinosidase, putative n=1 Tax=Aspergillus clavatus (strain ATCC 1007 / CBS 513.65 / DSM 816 / NCTC 3887 / NRRL 1 / QM 1276 / 107) TaxID=344612 RepID=A1CEL7_ASPCL|nr:xylosidase/arabinosidase, putative [Aspergillus clavatus NRRL 1]EAW11316.1 xylosidase/arabinosidase, putative [Aspergillus clavatus NRRL 1]
MKPIHSILPLTLTSLSSALQVPLDTITITTTMPRAGNPVIPGWYADPEARIFSSSYWLYPTYSAAYDSQTFFDAFSSPDLLTWTKHPRILDFASIPWSTNRAAWAPSVIRRRRTRTRTPSSSPSPSSSGDSDSDGDSDEYFMYFSAGDGAGIGVAKSTTGPGGPFADALGKPLVPETVFGAEPIDAQVFVDDDGGDGRAWLYFGGWGHAVVVELGDDLVSLKGEYREITPAGYVEGPWMLKRGGVYYFMFSVGGWGDDSYGVSYVTGSSPTGPFTSSPVKILSGNATVGKSTGHNSVVTPDGRDYYIVYHRRPVNETDRDHRVTCIDRMEFDADGNILPVVITTEGVEGRPLH